jgi:hypothetical protein
MPKDFDPIRSDAKQLEASDDEDEDLPLAKHDSYYPISDQKKPDDIIDTNQPDIKRNAQ